MSDELKSCPFCSSKNIKKVKYDKGLDLYRICCISCANGTTWYAKLKAAIEAWNKRA